MPAQLRGGGGGGGGGGGDGAICHVLTIASDSRTQRIFSILLLFLSRAMV